MRRSLCWLVLGVLTLTGCSLLIGDLSVPDLAAGPVDLGPAQDGGAADLDGSPDLADSQD